MEYRRLGRTGVSVSVQCLGAMMFGSYGNTDIDECVGMVRSALDHGINFIDTADRYSEGGSEGIVGRAIRGRRDDVVLTTKLSLPTGDGPNDRGSSRRYVMRAVERSLQRLGCDHIDVYILHRPDPLTDIDETLSALTDLVRQGKIRYFGSSTFPAWQIEDAHRASERRGLDRLAVEQPPYSILFRDIESDVLEVCRREGMGVMVWSPLASGLLTGRYGADRPFEEGSRATRSDQFGPGIASRFDREDPAVVDKLRTVQRIEDVARRAGIPLTHLATAFAIEHPSVTSAVVGPRTPAQLEDVLAGADVRLTSDVLDALDEIVPPGTHVPSADRRWVGPWMAPAARRRGSAPAQTADGVGR